MEISKTLHTFAENRTNQSVNMLQTDYSKVRGVVLSFPEGNSDPLYFNLTSFYLDLINLIPKELEISLICSEKEVFAKVESLSPHGNLKPIIIDGFQEIWLRDILGFKSGNKVFLPDYSPTYFTNHYSSRYLKKINEQVKDIHKELSHQIQEFPLKLDGGNFVTNGEISFITEKVRNDNSDIDTVGQIEETLGVKPFFLGHFPHDKLGHSDGYLCFLDTHSIALSVYPEKLSSLRKEKNYLEELKEELVYQRFNVISIQDRPVDEKIKSDGDWLYSARGSYVNFLRLNDNIILPQFDLPKSNEKIDYNSINKEVLSKAGYKVKVIQADDLYRLGGGLRCISWTY